MYKLKGLNAPQPGGESGSSFYREVVDYQRFIDSARLNNIKNKGLWQVVVQPPSFQYLEITNRLAHTLWVEINNNFGSNFEFLLERNQVKSITSPVSLYSITMTDITQNPTYRPQISREARAIADRDGSTIYHTALNVPDPMSSGGSANVTLAGGFVLITTSSVPIVSTLDTIQAKPPTNFTQQATITTLGVGVLIESKNAIQNVSNNTVASAGFFSGFHSINMSNDPMTIRVTQAEAVGNINPPLANIVLTIPAQTVLYHPLECAAIEVDGEALGQSVIAYQSLVYFGTDTQTLV